MTCIHIWWIYFRLEDIIPFHLLCNFSNITLLIVDIHALYHIPENIHALNHIALFSLEIFFFPVFMRDTSSSLEALKISCRSWPRPPRAFHVKATQEEAPASARHSSCKTQKSSRSKPSSKFVGLEMSNPKREVAPGFSHPTSNGILRDSQNGSRTYVEPIIQEFSDATSSDWSLFTSSDEASFTTESTRDSFSTVDYADTFNTDPISSLFSPSYMPEYASADPVSCRMFSNGKLETRYVQEKKGYVFDSYSPTQPDKAWKGENLKQVSVSTEFPSDCNCGMSLRYGSNPKDSFVRTSGCCKL